MACATSIHLMVTKNRVTDSLGGWCDHPSDLVHNSAPAVVEVASSASETTSTETTAVESTSTETTSTETTASETTARVL